MRQAVIIFTRIPVAGKTKTRLQQALTPEECAEAHCAFLKDIFAVVSSNGWEVFVFYSSEGSLEVLENVLPEQRKFYPQIGNDIGEKMYEAIATVLQKGCDSCVLIGADIPKIKKENIESAFEKLDFCDVVLGATLDGGYYLVGMKRANKKVFEKQIYGTKTVFESTIKSIKNAGLSLSTIDVENDIDEPHDLEKLWQNMILSKDDSCPNTRKFCSKIYNKR